MARMRGLSSQEPIPTLRRESCLCLVYADRCGHRNAHSADTTLRKPPAPAPRQHLCSRRRNNEEGAQRQLVKPLSPWEELEELK